MASPDLRVLALRAVVHAGWLNLFLSFFNFVVFKIWRNRSNFLAFFPPKLDKRKKGNSNYFCHHGPKICKNRKFNKPMRGLRDQPFPNIKHKRFWNSNGRWSTCMSRRLLQLMNKSFQQRLFWFFFGGQCFAKFQLEKYDFDLKNMISTYTKDF